MVNRRAGRLGWLGACLLAVFPSVIKRPLYRWLYGYKIGRRVQIGVSPFVGVDKCIIADDARIGHFNLFVDIGQLEIGAHAQIGFMNVFRGGDKISIGEYATILRRNVINSIPEPELVNSTEPVFLMGAGAVVTSGHWLDFTDRVVLGPHSIVGGRNSSFWTHNRQRTRPIEIGAHTYLGSEVRLAPGVSVATCCIVALGSVLTESFAQPLVLIAGNPATMLRTLNERDVFLVTRKTRVDIPSELAERFLPDDLRAQAPGSNAVRHVATAERT